MELMTLIHDQAPDAVIFAGKDGVIRAWNAAATRIFGFDSSEALGQSLDLIIPEQFREAHWTGFERALAAGSTKYSGKALPTRSQRKDGATIYVELSFAIIHDDSNQVIGALAHARDISERWAQDREQRRRLRDLEAKLNQAGIETTDAAG
ncbi:MAG TPA: PAS domain S-box protein [Dehalococcoidia bacterium]|nr:PAS domain S-box protein [Dehalococcoidia bacterium]